ncbi:hypothetical protein T492DRAFT_848731 [Pavlovales sp. CCMP2436]|nr:hypothetical protein T492DRAFT_848731 [Pavlovales sp. CCMP2436]
MRAFRLSAPPPDTPSALIQRHGYNYQRFLKPEERAKAEHVTPLPAAIGTRSKRAPRSHAVASHLQQGLMQPGVKLRFGASVEAARHETAAAGVTDGNLVPEADSWICEAPTLLSAHGDFGLGVPLATAVAPALLPAVPERAASAPDRWERGLWPGVSDGSFAPEADEWIYDAPPVPNTLGVSGPSLATAAGPTLGGAMQRVEVILAPGRAHVPSLLRGPSKQQPPQLPRAEDVDFWDDDFEDSRARSSIAPASQRPSPRPRAGQEALSLQVQSTDKTQKEPSKRCQTLLTAQCTASGESRVLGLFGAVEGRKSAGWADMCVLYFFKLAQGLKLPSAVDEESLMIPTKRQNLTAKTKAAAAGLAAAAEATMSLGQLEAILAQGWETIAPVAVELISADGNTSFNGGRGGAPPTRVCAARLLARPQGRDSLLATLALSETSITEAADITEACETVS